MTEDYVGALAWFKTLMEQGPFDPECEEARLIYKMLYTLACPY